MACLTRLGVVGGDLYEWWALVMWSTSSIFKGAGYELHKVQLPIVYMMR